MQQHLSPNTLASARDALAAPPPAVVSAVAMESAVGHDLADGSVMHPLRLKWFFLERHIKVVIGMRLNTKHNALIFLIAF